MTSLPHIRQLVAEKELGSGLLSSYNQCAGWSSLVARWAHNPKVAGSNPAPATIRTVQPQGWLFGPDFGNPTIRVRLPSATQSRRACLLMDFARNLSTLPHVQILSRW